MHPTFEEGRILTLVVADISGSELEQRE